MKTSSTTPLLLLLLLVLSPFLATTTQAGSPQSTTTSLHTLQLTSRDGQPAKVALGQGKNAFSMGVDGNGAFSLDHAGGPVLTVDKRGEMEVNTQVFSAAALNVDNNLLVGGVPQWRMVALDMWSEKNKTAADWDSTKFTTCQGITLLLPADPKNDAAAAADKPQTQGELNRVYKLKPTHTHLRVQANFHFVDDWQGECAYLKVDGSYVWTDCHTQTNRIAKTLNLCGAEQFPESKWQVPIDIAVPHTGREAKITFGSTAQPGMPCFFGVSSVQVSLRTKA